MYSSAGSAWLLRRNNTEMCQFFVICSEQVWTDCCCNVVIKKKTVRCDGVCFLSPSNYDWFLVDLSSWREMMKINEDVVICRWSWWLINIVWLLGTVLVFGETGICYVLLLNHCFWTAMMQWQNQRTNGRVCQCWWGICERIEYGKVSQMVSLKLSIIDIITAVIKLTPSTASSKVAQFADGWSPGRNRFEAQGLTVRIRAGAWYLPMAKVGNSLRRTSWRWQLQQVRWMCVKLRSRLLKTCEITANVSSRKCGSSVQFNCG